MTSATQPESEPTDGAPQSAAGRYVLAATLFLVFEAAMVLLVAWAVAFRGRALFGLVAAVPFVAFLTLGYSYACRQGAFDRD